MLEEFEAKYSKGLFGDRKLKKVEEEEKQALQNEMKALDKLTLRVKNTKDKIQALENGKLKGGNDINEVREQFGFTFVWKLDFAEVFREKNGFDIITGNPPYLNSRLFQEMKDVLSTRYKTPYGSYDIYVVFIEHGSDLLNQRGCLCLITSNKFLLADYGQALRQFIRENTRLVFIIDLADCTKVFEALVSPAILLLRKGTTNDEDTVGIAVLTGHDFNKMSRTMLNEISVSTIQKNPQKPFDIYIRKSSGKLLERIERDSSPLSHEGLVRTGIMGFDYWSLEPYIQDIAHARNRSMVRMVTNSHIEPFRFLWGKKIRLYKEAVQNPRIDLNCDLLNDSTREFFRSQKVIMRGVAMRTTASWDSEGHALLVAVHGFVPEELSGYFFTALFNSDLFDWLHKIRFYAARIPKGSLRYPISFWKNLPVKTNPKELIKGIGDLSEKASLSGKPPENSVRNEINQLILDLYEINRNELTY